MLTHLICSTPLEAVSWVMLFLDDFGAFVPFSSSSWRCVRPKVSSIFFFY